MNKNIAPLYLLLVLFSCGTKSETDLKNEIKTSDSTISTTYNTPLNEADVLFANSTLTIQTNINIRKSESTDSEIIAKLKQFDEVTYISQGKQDEIEGHIDYWYKIKNNKGVEGFIFGHYTSIKREGQKIATKKFTECSFGDLFHIIFEDIDFGQGNNQLGNYQDLCTEDKSSDFDDYIANPKYKNKKFDIIYNSLVAKVCCDPSCENTCIEKVPTIVSIKSIEIIGDQNM